MPPLLAATGTFASLRERLVAAPVADGARRVGRHAGLVAVPHGAKAFLAAALVARRRPASGSCGWPATRRSATGSPRSSAPGWATPTRWPSSSRAGARLRTQRARRGRDRGPRRRPGRMAERACPRPGRRRPGPAPAHDRPRRPAGRPAAPPRGARLARSALLRDLSTSATCRSTEVAGRGEFAGAVASSMSSRPRAACRSASSFLATRSICFARSIPTDQRTVRPGRRGRPPAGSQSSCRPGRRAGRDPRATRSGRRRFRSGRGSISRGSRGPPMSCVPRRHRAPPPPTPRPTATPRPPARTPRPATPAR